MPLPSAPNPISMSDVNTYLGYGATTTRSLNDQVVHQIFGLGTTTGTTISMSQGRGRYYPVSKSGGNRYPVGDDMYAIFDSITGNGTAWFYSEVQQVVRVLIVGGGAGGDYRYNSGGGGGGGGGVVDTTMTLNARQTYYVTVGDRGVGNGTTFAGASGGTSSFNGVSATGGLPSGYSGGYNYGRGGSPNGANGGNIGGYAGTTGVYSDITGSGYYYGSGGGGGGTTGGAGGWGAGNGGSTNQYGSGATGYGSGGGGGGFYNGSSYYYGGNGAAGVVIIRGNFRVSGIDAGY